jgi:hypothetical protein
MHDGLMSESNNSRIEAEECLRKANSCETIKTDRRGAFWLKVGCYWRRSTTSSRVGGVSKLTVRRLRLIRELYASALAQQLRQLRDVRRDPPFIVRSGVSQVPVVL